MWALFSGEFSFSPSLFFTGNGEFIKPCVVHSSTREKTRCETGCGDVGCQDRRAARGARCTSTKTPEVGAVRCSDLYNKNKKKKNTAPAFACAALGQTAAPNSCTRKRRGARWGVASSRRDYFWSHETSSALRAGSPLRRTGSTRGSRVVREFHHLFSCFGRSMSR